MPTINQIKVKNVIYDIRDAEAQNQKVPSGGNRGQFLSKNSDTSYDMSWEDIEVSSYTTAKENISIPVLDSTISVNSVSTWSSGTLPTLGTAISVNNITSWTTGELPTLGTAISTNKVTSWSTGTLPVLGNNITADNITSWSSGVLPTASVENEVLTITFGTLPTLEYTPKSIPNVTDVGTLPSLVYDSQSIPNITSVGILPNLEYESKSIPNVTNVGSLPNLQYTQKTINNIATTTKLVVTDIIES